MHRDVVLHYPPGVEKLGYTPRTEVPALYVQNRLISVQGHPEFDGAIVAAIAQSRYDMGLFDQELYDDAMSKFRYRRCTDIADFRIGRVYHPHHGSHIGYIFVKFLLNG